MNLETLFYERKPEEGTSAMFLCDPSIGFFQNWHSEMLQKANASEAG